MIFTNIPISISGMGSKQKSNLHSFSNDEINSSK